MNKSIYKNIGIFTTILAVIIAVFMLVGCSSSTTIDSIKVGDYDLKMGTYEGKQSEYVKQNDQYVDLGKNINIFIDDKNIKLDNQKHKYTIKDNTITADNIVLEVKSNDQFIYQVGAGVEMKLVNGYSVTKNTSNNLLANYKVVEAETKNIEYETFNNGLISMQIPKGWEVTIYPNCDAIHYTFIVRDPNNKNLQLFYNIKAEGFHASEQEQKMYAQYYPDQSFATNPLMNPMTTERVFQVFNQYSKDSGDFINPKINNFKKVESLGTNTITGETIRGAYTNESGENVEGIFNSCLKQYDWYMVHPVMLYCTTFYTAPEGELVNWQPILNNCLKSVVLSQTLTDTIKQQQDIQMQSIRDTARITSQISDIYQSAWDNRQAAYDRISQKRSDATLDYERVYNTDTGEIYKAYNGFTDDYGGDNYQPVTDDMYLQPISGYIEK